MGRQAAIFTSAAVASSTVMMPVARADTALPERFPWLASVSSSPVRRTDASLDREFALYAEEAREWADLALSAALENWPDDWRGE